MKRFILLSILLIIASAVFAQEAETGSYEIGGTGPGGGMIFYINGNTYLECSDNLGEVDWDEAMQMAEDYRDGGYDDWYLPNSNELNYIYENLCVKGVISDNDWLWSSSEYYSNIYAWGQGFSDGYQTYHFKTYDSNVRLVRSFSP